MPTIELLEKDDAGELMGQRQSAERQAMIDLVELETVWPSDHEAQVAAALAAFFQKPAEGHRVHLLAGGVEERDEGPRGQPAQHALLFADLDELEASVAADELLIVLDVVGERWTQATHGDDDDSHDGILGRMEDPNRPERHINIHFSPDIMAGVYSNFANVSHSDYEFTITFARVDHEVEDEEIPGVVVSRINLSPRFMRELIDAMQDNYSKWQTREGIKNLPEYGGGESGEPA